MKKYILLAVFAAFAASLHAQTTEDTITENGSLTSLEMMKIEMLEEGLTSANVQIIDLNKRLRNNAAWTVGGIGCAAASSFFLYSANKHELEHQWNDKRPKTERGFGYAFAAGGAVCLLAVIVNMWTPCAHHENGGLVIKFGKPKDTLKKELR